MHDRSMNRNAANHLSRMHCSEIARGMMSLMVTGIETCDLRPCTASSWHVRGIKNDKSAAADSEDVIKDEEPVASAPEEFC